MPFFKFALWMMWLSSSQINHICFWNVIRFRFLFLLANILRAPIMGKAKKSYVQIILLITWMVHLINCPSILFWNKYLRWTTSKPLCPTLYGAVCIHRVYSSCMFFLLSGYFLWNIWSMTSGKDWWVDHTPAWWTDPIVPRKMLQC